MRHIALVGIGCRVIELEHLNAKQVVVEGMCTLSKDMGVLWLIL